MPYVRSEFGHTSPCWEPMLSWFGEFSLRWAVSGPSCWAMTTIYGLGGGCACPGGRGLESPGGFVDRLVRVLLFTS